MTRIRVGVLGCADIAARRTVPAMRRTPGLEVVAVASRDPARAERFGARFGLRPVPGYERLLADDGVDAVYVPLPAVLHAEWVERALRAGKHVFAEKPLTDRYDRTAALVDLARERGLVLMENTMFLHHSQHEEVRRRLADGLLGELRGLSAVFTIPPKPAGDMRYLPDVGGGALLDVGVYPVRTALHFLGPDCDVVGAVLRDSPRGATLSGHVLLAAPGGVAAELSFGMEHPYRSRYELTGSLGRLRLDRAYTPPADHRPVLELDPGDRVVLAPDDQFAGSTAAFARAVVAGSAPAGHLEGVLRQAALVDRINAAARRVVIEPDPGRTW
ncbi:Gfo/Idh/MocA family protein [Saccharothrix obliqua]|uniref:Gfo/Idh/MocA family protein n=1 Tax=Saccharothrix obliqua TaxID=2861747 RepID=UPI001C5EE2E4|nr:Gfo/Idh/MocA family oxidoreductase [Saccharothrix obliqua]MBW4721884.1 Gfo/Idh/MocA family oxidoreductase [Saccharothrix obliqua]